MNTEDNILACILLAFIAGLAMYISDSEINILLRLINV